MTSSPTTTLETVSGCMTMVQCQQYGSMVSRVVLHHSPAGVPVITTMMVQPGALSLQNVLKTHVQDGLTSLQAVPVNLVLPIMAAPDWKSFTVLQKVPATGHRPISSDLPA